MAQHGATPVDYFTDNDVPSQQQLPPVPVSVCNPTAPATTETTQQPVRLFNTATKPGAATGANKYSFGFTMRGLDKTDEWCIDRRKY